MLRPCAGFQRSFLPLLYFQPVDKAVDVVDKKYEKAYRYGYIRYIRQRSQDPEYDQHNIVRRIGKREQGTAFIGQPDGDCGLFRYRVSYCSFSFLTEKTY